MHGQVQIFVQIALICKFVDDVLYQIGQIFALVNSDHINQTIFQAFFVQILYSRENKQRCE